MTDSELCVWTEIPEDRDDPGVFLVSGCGNVFQSAGGAPEENGFLFCPYCGAPLKWHRPEVDTVAP
jgi:hypothetical protein